jgi:hypothetical protein
MQFALATDIESSMNTNRNLVLPLVGAAILSAVFGAGTAFAASSAIGLAVANGSFHVDRAQVWGSSSLFEGSTVETATTGSQLHVNGVDVRLAADTRVKVYGSRMILEQGFTELRAASGFTVEARSLTIAPRSREAVTRIKLQGSRKVTVAAMGGSVDVRNGGGLLVARVAANTSLDFEPQTTSGTGAGSTPQTGAGAAGSSAGGASGSASDAAAQTGAAGASGTAGSTAAGAGGAAGATAAGGNGAAGAAAAGAGAAAAAGAGIGAGTIVIIGGVAVAATLGGLAATGSLPGQSQSTPSASQ